MFNLLYYYPWENLGYSSIINRVQFRKQCCSKHSVRFYQVMEESDSEEGGASLQFVLPQRNIDREMISIRRQLFSHSTELALAFKKSVENGMRPLWVIPDDTLIVKPSKRVKNTDN